MSPPHRLPHPSTSASSPGGQRRSACIPLLRAALVALVLLPQPSAAQPAMVKALVLAREADQALAAGNKGESLEKIQAAVALRPDVPRLLVTLATAHAANDQPDDALAALEQLASLGMHTDVERASEFAAWRSRPAFQAIARKLADNLHPMGEGEIAFTLRDMTGLIEGIAWREKTGEFFFGDVHARTVWVRTGDKVRPFYTGSEEAIGGVFGLLVDEAGGVLWAATSAVPEMRGYTPEMEGAAGVAEIDLGSGALRRVVLVPDDGRPHVIGDLARAQDGTLYFPDRRASVIWRLAPGAEVLESFVESGEFLSLRGIAVTADGGALLVADRLNGLLRIDLNSRTVERLEPPRDSTLIGLDGLGLAPNGDLLAVQGTTTPRRALRVVLSRGGTQVERVGVIDSGHFNMPAPALGCVGTGGDFFFIANPGWNRFDGRAQPTEPRAIGVFRSKL